MVHRQHTEVCVLVIPNMYAETKRLLGKGYSVISFLNQLTSDSNYDILRQWIEEKHKDYLRLNNESLNITNNTESGTYVPLTIVKVQGNPDRVKKGTNKRIRKNQVVKGKNTNLLAKNLKKIKN